MVHKFNTDLCAYLSSERPKKVILPIELEQVFGELPFMNHSQLTHIKFQLGIEKEAYPEMKAKAQSFFLRKQKELDNLASAMSNLGISV